jgi:hypothetical protein
MTLSQEQFRQQVTEEQPKLIGVMQQLRTLCKLRGYIQSNIEQQTIHREQQVWILTNIVRTTWKTIAPPSSGQVC